MAELGRKKAQAEGELKKLEKMRAKKERDIVDRLGGAKKEFEREKNKLNLVQEVVKTEDACTQRVPQMIMEKMRYVAEVWTRGLLMRDRYRGFLRWKRMTTKASAAPKRKKKKKKKVVCMTGEDFVEDNEGVVRGNLENGDGWWTEQVGAEQAVEFYEGKKRSRAYAHWAIRAAVTHQRQERAAAKLQRRWEWIGGMPEPRARVGMEEGKGERGGRRTGSSGVGGDDNGCVWWWEEREGEEKAVQFYVARWQRKALRHYALTSARLYIRDMVLRFYRMQVQKKALRYWRQGTTGYQSVGMGMADATAEVEAVIPQIVKALFADGQIMEWVQAQAVKREVGVAVAMQELAMFASREVVCRSMKVMDTVLAIKRMMTTDALIK